MVIILGAIFQSCPFFIFSGRSKSWYTTSSASFLGTFPKGEGLGGSPSPTISRSQREHFTIATQSFQESVGFISRPKVISLRICDAPPLPSHVRIANISRLQRNHFKTKGHFIAHLRCAPLRQNHQIFLFILVIRFFRSNMVKYIYRQYVSEEMKGGVICTE